MTRHFLVAATALLSAAASVAAGACSPSTGPGYSGTEGASSSGGGGGSSGGSGGSSTGGSSGGSGGSSGGSSSHAGSSSGSNGSSSSSSGSSVVLDASAFDSGPPPALFYDGGPIACGTPCSLKTQTCCLDNQNDAVCVDHGASCPAPSSPLFPYASFSCKAASDCSGSGMVCCGVADSLTLTASTSCQSVSSPGQCAPTTSTTTMGSAQLCASHAECAPGVQCIPQKCVGGSNFFLCGLHSAAPFKCTQTGAPN